MERNKYKIKVFLVVFVTFFISAILLLLGNAVVREMLYLEFVIAGILSGPSSFAPRPELLVLSVICLIISMAALVQCFLLLHKGADE